MLHHPYKKLLQHYGLVPPPFQNLFDKVNHFGRRVGDALSLQCCEDQLSVYYICNIPVYYICNMMVTEPTSWYNPEIRTEVDKSGTNPNVKHLMKGADKTTEKLGDSLRIKKSSNYLGSSRGSTQSPI